MSSFVLILLGVLVSGSLFSIGFMQIVRKRPVLGIVLSVAALLLFISMFVFIKEPAPIQSVS
ncbi:hypothetical protein ACFFK0_30050 [Paenibacillus chartarius]|uniref:Uncharacterized protein n=1 Tax=Paenibacillus chartarius TaxID=747481 RepID=A0ABV6DVF6_9BACL